LFINLTPFRYLFRTPSPFVPLPLIKGKGAGYVREASPLFNSPLISLSLKGEGEGILERGFAPLTSTPLPFVR